MSEDKKKDNDIFLKTRTVLITGEIDKKMSEKVIRELLALENEGDDPIRVFIDSPGGDVDAAFAIFDTIRFIKPKVIMVAVGLAASAGALILLAGEKENRFGFPNSHYMIHQPLSGIRGVATDIQIHAAELEKTRQKLNRLIAEETGRSEEQVEKDTDRNYWLSAEEAAEYGLISKIVSRRNELP